MTRTPKPRRSALPVRYTVEPAVYFRVWDDLLKKYVNEVTDSTAVDEESAQRLADSLDAIR